MIFEAFLTVIYVTSFPAPVQTQDYNVVFPQDQLYSLSPGATLKHDALLAQLLAQQLLQ